MQYELNCKDTLSNNMLTSVWNIYFAHFVYFEMQNKKYIKLNLTIK